MALARTATRTPGARTGAGPVAALPDPLAADDAAALHLAAHLGRLDVVERAVAAGVDVDAPGAEGQTALHAAVAGRRLDVVVLLLRLGADIEKPWRGQRPLHLAVHAGSAELVGFLVQQGCDPDAAEDAHGHTALHLAALRGCRPIAAALLRNGASTEARDREGRVATQCWNDGAVHPLAYFPGVVGGQALFHWFASRRSLAVAPPSSAAGGSDPAASPAVAAAGGAGDATGERFVADVAEVAAALRRDRPGLPAGAERLLASITGGRPTVTFTEFRRFWTSVVPDS